MMIVLVIMTFLGAGLGLVYGADVASTAIPAGSTADAIYATMATHARWGAVVGLAVGLGLWAAKLWRSSNAQPTQD